ASQRDAPIPPTQAPEELPDAAEQRPLVRHAVDDEVSEGRLHEQTDDAERPAGPAEEEQQDRGEEDDAEIALEHAGAEYGLRGRIVSVDDSFEPGDFFFARAIAAAAADAEPRFQRANYLVHALVAIARALGHHPLDDGGEFRR